MTRIILLLAAACLSGCAAAIPPLVGAAVGGGACMATTAEDTADLAISAAKPIKAQMCKTWLAEPHHATLATWCANLPEDLDGLAAQWAAVGVTAAISDPLLPGNTGP